MNIMSKDLDLLKVLLIVSEELNLTKASARLKLSQPALSHALQRLREEFGDPLLVRASRGLVATDRAKSLLPRVRQVLAMAEELYAVEDGSPKNFRSVERTFVLGTTTYFELRVISPLLARLASEAPGVTLETRSLQGEFPKEELEHGEIDLAVAAYFDKTPESFRTRILGRDPHVCVARKGNPFLKSKRTLEDYLRAKHIRINVPPGRPSAIDVTLKKRGKKRRIVAHVANFLTPPWILSQSDSLLTCPESLARRYAEAFALEITPLPIDSPPIEVKMIWHERAHADPFQRWMRDAIAALTSGSRLTSSPN